MNLSRRSSTRCRASRRRSSTTRTTLGRSTRPSRLPEPSDALATQTARGGTIFGIYPLNRYARLEVTGGLIAVQAGVQRPTLQQVGDRVPAATYGRTLFADGKLLPLGAAYVRETTVFREYGPLSGDTLRGRVRVRAEDRQLHLAADPRRRRAQVHAPGDQRRAGLPLPRLQELGRLPHLPVLRRQLGNARLRVPASSSATRAFFADAELRFPLIEAALTPLGVIGGLRAVAFANFGASQLAASRCRSTTDKPTIGAADHRLRADPTSHQPDRARSRLRRGRSPDCVWSTAAPPTASASRPSRSASRSTSTGRGGRCSTRAGKTTCTPTARSWTASQRQQVAAQAEVLDLDRLRFLIRGLAAERHSFATARRLPKLVLRLRAVLALGVGN